MYYRRESPPPARRNPLPDGSSPLGMLRHHQKDLLHPETCLLTVRTWPWSEKRLLRACVVCAALTSAAWSWCTCFLFHEGTVLDKNVLGTLQWRAGECRGLQSQSSPAPAPLVSLAAHTSPRGPPLQFPGPADRSYFSGSPRVGIWERVSSPG